MQPAPEPSPSAVRFPDHVRRIVGATIVPEPGIQLDDAEIAFHTGTGVIDYLGPVRGPARPEDLDARGRIVAPGLVNGHTHSSMTMLRGWCDDLPLDLWLAQMRRFEVRMTAADIRAGLRLAMVEMLRSGTIGFVDMFSWNTELLGDVVDSGMRVRASPGVFGYGAVAFPMAEPEAGGVVLDEVPALAAEFAGEARITMDYGLHAPYTCPPDLIADVARRAIDRDLGVQIHLSETRREVAQSLTDHGMSPIAHVAGLGLFDTRLHVAHAVHPEPGDIDLLARPNVTVSHNPVSNLKLGAGIAPVPEYLAAGVTLGLGTDSVASNNTLDMFEEIKTGALVQRGLHTDPLALSAPAVLSMATRGGARSLSQGLSGRLAVGEQADLIVLDASGITASPNGDAGSFLGYAARGTDVTDVVIAGRQVVADRVVLTVDEEAARLDVRERVTRVRGELDAR
nr:amidohydrolase [Nakamurella flavida]